MACKQGIGLAAVAGGLDIFLHRTPATAENDPADIGQAILAGSVTNTATGSKKGLTISVSQAAQKVLLGRDEMKASGGPK